MHPRDYSNIKRLSFKERFPRYWSLEGLEVLLHIDSFCLGDTVCFASFLDAFHEKYRPKSLKVSTFWPELFESERFDFLDAVSEEAIEVDKFVSVGFVKENIDHTSNGMIWAARNSMGIPQEEPPVRPPLRPLDLEVQRKVCIATESLKKIARWERPDGWHSVVRHILDLGFEVHNVSFEKGREIEGVIYHDGNEDIMVAAGHICESALLVGLSSGLSWLAWGYGTPVVMISGFTKPHNEFECYRVVNEKRCFGCHNVFPNVQSPCPIFANTPRANECHELITPEMVIEKVDEALADNGWI